MFFQFPNRGKFGRICGPTHDATRLSIICGICGGSAAAIVDRCEASASDRYGHLGVCCNPKAKGRTAEIRGSAPGRRTAPAFNIFKCDPMWGVCIS